MTNDSMTDYGRTAGTLPLSQRIGVINSLILISPDRGEAFNQFFLVMGNERKR
jgi:hypothetical protein